MKISIRDIGKKYNKSWVFRNVSFELDEGQKLAITGHNGSGKSTLLSIIGGYTAPTEGQIEYHGVKKDNFQIHFSIAAPYLNLIEEYTLKEHLAFHSHFKEPLLQTAEMIHACGLEGAENKHVAEFSSGMKQRLRLALAFFYQSQVILLDEPSSNLDKQGLEWYLDLIDRHAGNRSLIIASNQPEEYKMCADLLHIENFKKKP